MSFIETPRFPDDVAINATGGPLFLVDVVELNSGYEQRNTSWSQARAQYSIALPARDDSLRDALLAFIRAIAKGRLNGFRFKDYTDYQATHADSAAGLGKFSSVSSGVWQMTKRYTSGATTFDRNITKPVSSTVQIKNGAGSVLVSGVDYTLDSTTGRVTVLGSPTPQPSTWSGEFDIPVRLNNDYAALRALFSGLSDWPSIELIEIRT